MGRRSISGGVRAKGANRIEFTFTLYGVRYRPTLLRRPSEANLQRARVRLKRIKTRIRNGTFVFTDEFPDYRYLDQLSTPQPCRTCNDVFDEYLEHCRSRMAKHDLTWTTLEGYRTILDSTWR